MNRTERANLAQETLKILENGRYVNNQDETVEIRDLGAWGCGVFKNDPATVAAVFGDLLLDGGPYRGCFSAVRFSIFDDSTELKTFKAFSRTLFSSDEHGAHHHQLLPDGSEADCR